MAKQCLFEVSWEICNKVGGIYTVIRSKLPAVAAAFGDSYIALGPWLSENPDFVDASDDDAFWQPIRAALSAKNLYCRVGYWEVSGKPKAILVGYQNRYHVNELLYDIWQAYRVDSLSANYDFIEPILFSTAAAEVIETVASTGVFGSDIPVAHFHEWLCGAGVLYLKSHVPSIASVFTTHATVLGRALASRDISIFQLPQAFDPLAEAKKAGVLAKHSMERAAAHAATCFTTVSNLTAEEAAIMLEKYPDKVVPNGLDLSDPFYQLPTEKIARTVKEKCLSVCRDILQTDLPADTRLWVSSGRYEFHNKGYDVLLKAVEQLNQTMTESDPPVVVLMLIAVRRTQASESLIGTESILPEAGIATHRIHESHQDPIVSFCRAHKLNVKDHRVKVVYCPAYLDGNDGVFDCTYEQLLSICDWSIFPSFYEPWGYTPLESIAMGVPTITTNLAGFGLWAAENTAGDEQTLVTVHDRQHTSFDAAVSRLYQTLRDQALRADPAERQEHAEICRNIAAKDDWSIVHTGYLETYQQAARYLSINSESDAYLDAGWKPLGAMTQSEQATPRFRQCQCEAALPDSLTGLRRLAENYWWSWQDAARALFAELDPDLWDRVEHNPLRLLNEIAFEELTERSTDDAYLEKLQVVLQRFDTYLSTQTQMVSAGETTIRPDRPIAYFCLEYGIHESLPNYSGGLGILAGDYLKEMSDRYVPFFAIGLYYRQGYFKQSINHQGEQIAIFSDFDRAQIPMRRLMDADGNPLAVNVDLQGRTVVLYVWQVTVGRVKLYLLDPDNAENPQHFRDITTSLYGGNKETRIQQEIILGLGGVRLINDHLKLTPSLYHLNEGHSAFLLLERIKNQMDKGHDLDTAIEIVRSSSVFTTHTPVPAGNETFEEGLVQKYFSGYFEFLHLPIERFLAFARDQQAGKTVFSMTILALRLTTAANSVSLLHRSIAREMWSKLWPSFLDAESPIDNVTNGIHPASWIGPEVQALYREKIAADWAAQTGNRNLWAKVTEIEEEDVWRAHQAQKIRLLAHLKDKIVEEYTGRGESVELLHATLRTLSEDTLLIGFARRFATYKRSDFIFHNLDRLGHLLTDPNKPIVILIAGKAHPQDTLGQGVIQNVVRAMREKSLKGHVIFLEKYNMSLGRLLVQGVDIWLNNPVLYAEACGTSGMKASMNGAVNVSVEDGWWAEAYQSEIGWSIVSLDNQPDFNKRNEIESAFLLDSLENDIAPLYYDKKGKGYSTGWLAKMRAAMATVGCDFCTHRMVGDYLKDIYGPAWQYHQSLMAVDAEGLRALTDWKQQIHERFQTVHIKKALVRGMHEGFISAAEPLAIKVFLDAGSMRAEELCVELVLTRRVHAERFQPEPVCILLEPEDSTQKSGLLIYGVTQTIVQPGVYDYGIRIYPQHPNLAHREDVETASWV